ncbi:MAG: sel1 repeat family protein [Gammaproteobacteria bacterium]|nr:sel1 repeat family protein [Gammaproteobacteria bacterium]MBQ0840523.1 sel1 repeat family protein [Gammaproteobacteria bacterium]
MFLLRLCVLLFLPHTLLAATDISAELGSAQTLLSTGDYSAAYVAYQRVAQEHNSPLAQFTVGMFYDQGWGRPMDRAEACRWYEKAAAGDIPAAAHFLGECLLEGIHQPANPQSAAQWFQKAAGLGHYSSLCSLGELYVSGVGVAQDRAKGLALCKQAAERGVLSATERMGQFYLEAEGEQRDLAMAVQWFTQAARANSARAQYQLGLMLREGQGQAVDLAAARYWFESAASQGYISAYFPTAALYYETPKDADSGLWPEQELAKAYLWLSATKQRSTKPDQQKQVAIMLEQVLAVMPISWVKDLDSKVAEHLALQASPAPAG